MPCGIPISDVLLRDQFIEHVLDDMLHRELKRRVIQGPAFSFVDLHAVAIRWTETSKQGGTLVTHSPRQWIVLRPAQMLSLLGLKMK